MVSFNNNGAVFENMACRYTAFFSLAVLLLFTVHPAHATSPVYKVPGDSALKVQTDEREVLITYLKLRIADVEKRIRMLLEARKQQADRTVIHLPNIQLLTSLVDRRSPSLSELNTGDTLSISDIIEQRKTESRQIQKELKPTSTERVITDAPQTSSLPSGLPSALSARRTVSSFSSTSDGVSVQQPVQPGEGDVPQRRPPVSHYMLPTGPQDSSITAPTIYWK